MLKAEHIEYVLDCLFKNVASMVKIRNFHFLTHHYKTKTYAAVAEKQIYSMKKSNVFEKYGLRGGGRTIHVTLLCSL